VPNLHNEPIFSLRIQPVLSCRLPSALQILPGSATSTVRPARVYRTTACLRVAVSRALARVIPDRAAASAPDLALRHLCSITSFRWGRQVEPSSCGTDTPDVLVSDALQTASPGDLISGLVERARFLVSLRGAITILMTAECDFSSKKKNALIPSQVFARISARGGVGLLLARASRSQGRGPRCLS
jgi:hypothetical protein